MFKKVIMLAISITLVMNTLCFALDVGKVYKMDSTNKLESAIATSKKSWEKFKKAIISDDKRSVIIMMSTGEIIGIQNGSKVKYLGSYKTVSGVAKIEILEGDWVGETGYTFKNNLN